MEVKKEAYIEKADKLSDGEVEFVVSTGALDAHGERISIEGIDTKNYLKNPVVLWSHEAWNLPIANTTKLWVQGKGKRAKLMARAKFFTEYEFPAKVYEYITKGYIKAVSIGGRVTEWSENWDVIEQLDMREFSVVSIPANPEALVSSKSLDTKELSSLDKLASIYVRDKVLNEDKNELRDEIKSLDKLVTTLKGLVEPDETREESVAKSKLRVVLRQTQAVDHQTEKVIKIIKLKSKEN